MFNILVKCSEYWQAKLVSELNAISALEMGDLDFDAIINAYDRITPDYFFGVGEDQAIVILSHCLYDIKSEELILRQSAYKSLLSFVNFSAMIIEGEKMVLNGSYWNNSRVQHIVNKFLLKHMGDAMSKGTSMRKVKMSQF